MASANPVPERLLAFLADNWADPARPTPVADPRVGAWAERRRRLSEAFPDRTLVVRAGHEVVRNATTTYAFRAHSDFIYLCGAAEPDAVLVIHPGGGSQLFVHTPHARCAVEWFTDPARSPLWAGPQAEPEELAARLGIEVLPLTSLPDEYRATHADATFDHEVSRAAARLRLLKDPFEVESLRAAASASLVEIGRAHV